MSYLALLFCQDEKTARTVTQVLSELEFEVDLCAETFAAVKKLTSQPFEAVVVDCQNEESASLLLKAARNSTFNQASLMVALVEGQAGVAAAFRIGANLVLTKPIAVEQARGTLRVARGLLRKNSGAPAPAPTATATVAAPSLPSTVAPAQPQASAPAPKPEPTRPLATPATAPAAAIPAPPRVTPSAPVLPSAFRAVASAAGSLEQQQEPQPAPDAASAGLLESLDFKSYNTPPHSVFTPSASEVVSVSEVSTGAHEAVRAALTPKAPISSQDFIARSETKLDFGTGAYSAAAAAPAKEVAKLAAPATSSEVSDLFEAPVFGQTSSPSVAEPEAAPYEPELDFTGSPTPSRSKMPLIAVAAIFALCAVLYFGWAQLHKPAPTATPTAGPLQPPPPDFGAADPTPQIPPPAKVTAATHSAPAAEDDSAPVESVNRFAHPQPKVAEDRVTTPIAIATPRSAQAPIEVKTQLQHAAVTASASQENAEAPAIASLGTSAKPDALSSIAPTTTALPVHSRVSEGVSQAMLIKSVQPVYPQQAIQIHAQGVVVLKATVAKDGSVRDVKVVSGPAVLTRAATDAVKQWKYKPFTLNGEPVENQVDVKINFVPPR